MIRIFIAAAICGMCSTAALAELSLERMSKANGLANIIANAGACDYSVDQGALESYYVASGLATPEALSYISAAVSLAQYGDEPSESECTMARVTAKALGIVE